MADPLSYFSFQPVLHNWCNKGRGMCYPVYGMYVEKSRPCSGGSGVFLYHFLNGPLPYVRRQITVNKNVLSASLNKTFPSFLPFLTALLSNATMISSSKSEVFTKKQQQKNGNALSPHCTLFRPKNESV